MLQDNNGIIYVMTSVVPGLVKIGKTGVSNYEQRMYELEHNGYRNVTGLKRAFAIEVESYDEKEKLLHTIFEKSRVSDTELFALDVTIAVKLLSSFDGKVVFPKTETKEEVFEEAVESGQSKSIPDGIYHFKKKKKSDNKMVNAIARIVNGKWTLLKGSLLGVTEDKGTTKKSRATRELFFLREKRGESKSNDFLNVGSMGHASSVALGIALEKTDRNVVALDGDCACIMHMGAMTMVSTLDVPTFIHVVLNNGAHESVGGQPSAGHKLDFTKIAEACGYATVGKAVETKEELVSALRTLKDCGRASFIDCRIHKGLNSKLPPIVFDHRDAINSLIKELNK